MRDDGGSNGDGTGCRRMERASGIKIIFQRAPPTARVPPRNFNPLISDGMIIRGDISRESGTWLNVDFIAARKGTVARAVRKFPRKFTKKATTTARPCLRLAGEVVN